MVNKRLFQIFKLSYYIDGCNERPYCPLSKDERGHCSKFLLQCPVQPPSPLDLLLCHLTLTPPSATVSFTPYKICYNGTCLPKTATVSSTYCVGVGDTIADISGGRGHCTRMCSESLCHIILRICDD